MVLASSSYTWYIKIFNVVTHVSRLTRYFTLNGLLQLSHPPSGRPSWASTWHQAPHSELPSNTIRCRCRRGSSFNRWHQDHGPRADLVMGVRGAWQSKNIVEAENFSKIVCRSSRAVLNSWESQLSIEPILSNVNKFLALIQSFPIIVLVWMFFPYNLLTTPN